MAKKAAKKAAKPRVAKPKADKPAAKPRAAKAVLNFIDPEKQALFNVNREKWERLNQAVQKAVAQRRSHEKTIKGDGFTLSQIKVGVECSTPEGEAALQSRIANDLLAAAYVGADIGTQLSLFIEPSRVPATERAATEGAVDAQTNKPAKPKYDPSTPQYKAYMDSYHEEQGRQLKAGIKPLDESEPGAKLIKKSEKDAAAASKKDAGPPPAKPQISKGLTHKEQSRADKDTQAAAKATADKYFKPGGGDFGSIN